MKKNMKLSTKLIGGFTIVAAVTLIVGLIGWYGVSKMSAHLHEVGEIRLPSVSSLLVISEAQSAVDSAENVLLNKVLDNDTRQNAYKRISEGFERVNTAWKIYEPLPQSKEEAAVWRKFVPAWEKWIKDDTEFIRLVKEYEQNKSEDTYKKMVDQALVTNAISFKEAESLLNQIVQINNDISAEENRQGKADTALVMTISIVGMIFGTIIALALGIFLATSISRALLASVESLNEGSQQVASASGQLSSASQQLAEGNAELASSIEETSSTLEESSSMVQQNTENTKHAAMLSAQTKTVADKGNIEMKEMMSSMSEIKKSSDQIAKIIKVIDEIAFQTNILALNAAVEAARAGDAGMGFAVVAEEVRNLAQRSAQAAKDTEAIIDTNIELSNKGVEVTRKVGESLSEITIQAKKVNELMEEISASSNEQSQGIMQINKAITQMEQVTQQNAANAEETASASEELNAQAETLKDIVQQIVQLVNGSTESYSLQKGSHAKISSKANSNNTIQHRTSVQTVRNNKSGLNSMHGLEYRNQIKRTQPVDPEAIIPLEDDASDF